MIYIGAVSLYALAVVGFCWIWSKRQPPSMAEVQAENAEQMAWLSARAKARAAKARGDKRGEGEALREVRAANHARLSAEIVQMRGAK